MDVTKKRYNVVVISAGRLVREGIKHVLQNSPFFVQRDGSTIDALMAGPNEGDPINIVICSLNLDERAQTELMATEKICATFPAAKLVVVTNVVSAAGVQRAIDAGVAGVLSAELSDDVLQCYLQLIGLGETLFPTKILRAEDVDAAVIPPEDMAAVADVRASRESDIRRRPASFSPPVKTAMDPDQSSMVQLSERENEVLRGLTLGSSNKIMARTLGLAEATVKVHIRGILRKIRVRNRTQAAVWAMNRKPSSEGRNGRSQPAMRS